MPSQTLWRWREHFTNNTLKVWVTLTSPFNYLAMATVWQFNFTWMICPTETLISWYPFRDIVHPGQVLQCCSPSWWLACISSWWWLACISSWERFSLLYLIRRCFYITAIIVSCVRKCGLDWVQSPSMACYSHSVLTWALPPMVVFQAPLVWKEAGTPNMMTPKTGDSPLLGFCLFLLVVSAELCGWVYVIRWALSLLLPRDDGYIVLGFMSLRLEHWNDRARSPLRHGSS